MTTKHVYHFIGGKRARHNMVSHRDPKHDVHGIMIMPPSSEEWHQYNIQRKAGKDCQVPPTSEYRVVATEAFTNGPKEDGSPADIEAVYFMIPASVSPNHEALFMAQYIRGLYRNEAALQARIDALTAVDK